MTFFTEVQQTIQTFLWSHQRPRIANAILRNTNQAGGITLPDLRQYHKASVLRTVWYWYQNRQTDHGIRRENPEASPDTYGHLIFAKGGKDRKMGKDCLFSKKCWETWAAAWKAEHPRTPCTDINSTWLRVFGVRQDTIKVLEGNTGRTFSDINLTKVFSGQSPNATEIRAKIKRWDLIKLTSFCSAKKRRKKNQETAYRMGESSFK